MTRPADNAPSSTWTWWVSSGETVAERQERLRQVPADLQAAVEAHVRRIWRHRPKSGARD